MKIVIEVLLLQNKMNEMKPAEINQKMKSGIPNGSRFF